MDQTSLLIILGFALLFLLVFVIFIIQGNKGPPTP